MMASFEPLPLTDQLESLMLTDPLSSAVDHSSNGSDPLLNPPLSPPSSIIDPPSYADVIFAPSSPASTPSPPPSSPYGFLKITVSDPKKDQEPNGSASFVSYLVTTAQTLYSDQVTKFAVRRRFSDFVTLADRLAESYRGLFIPLRPDKSLIESQVMQKQDFVEQRRLALEKYLSKLAKHPIIGKSDEFRAFLMVEGRLPIEGSTDVASRVIEGAVRLPKQLWGGEGGGVGEPVEAVGPVKGGIDLLRMFRELKQSVANDWGGGRPPAVEEDKEFLERKDRVKELETQLSNVSQQAEVLVKAQQDVGETMGELGLAFFKLGKFETEEAIYDSQRTRAADVKRLATSAVRASRSYRELNVHTVKHLDTLHEYLGMMLAVNSAFSDRSSALLTVQTLMSDLSSLHARAEKLEAASSKIFGVDKSRIQRLEELRETIRKTEGDKSYAIRQYERIKENNRDELERLDRERRHDFLGMLKGFVINQVGYAEKNAGIWSQVVEETSRYAKQSHS